MGRAGERALGGGERGRHCDLSNGREDAESRLVNRRRRGLGSHAGGHIGIRIVAGRAYGDRFRAVNDRRVADDEEAGREDGQSLLSSIDFSASIVVSAIVKGLRFPQEPLRTLRLCAFAPLRGTRSRGQVSRKGAKFANRPGAEPSAKKSFLSRRDCCKLAARARVDLKNLHSTCSPDSASSEVF